MKYSIKNLEKGKIIENVHKVKGANGNSLLMIDYLDGTQDVIECNKENIDSIQTIVNKQAEQFVSQQKSKISWKFLYTGFACVSLGALALTMAGLISSSGIVIDSIIAILGGASFIKAVSLSIKENDTNKYELYLNKVAQNLEKYEEIINKENELVKENYKKNVKFDPLNIDSYSINKVQEVANKLERYNEYHQQKTKTL